MAVLDNVNLLLVLGDEKYKWEVYAEFEVVDISLAYSVILERLVINYHRIIINIGSLYLKLAAPGRLAVIRAVKSQHKSVIDTLPKA